LVLTGAGCGSSSRKLVPVEGIVTLEGEPLGGATVSFVPVSGGGLPASGRTSADGTFHLTTYSADDGALPGDYKVLVLKFEQLHQPQGFDPTDGKQAQDMMRKMMDPPKAKKGAATTTKAKSPVHANYQNESKTPLRARVPPDGKVRVPLNKAGT
jgi:hypothetical protein